jgi:hypothetical protein
MVLHRQPPRPSSPLTASRLTTLSSSHQSSNPSRRLSRRTSPPLSPDLATRSFSRRLQRRSPTAASQRSPDAAEGGAPPQRSPGTAEEEPQRCWRRSPTDPTSRDAVPYGYRPNLAVLYSCAPVSPLRLPKSLKSKVEWVGRRSFFLWKSKVSSVVELFMWRL